MRQLLISLFLLLSIINLQAQDEDPFLPGSMSKNKFFVGGGLGLQLGTFTNINVSPIFGYHLTNHLSFGAGFAYQYYREKFYSPPLVLNIWGGRAFANLYFIPEFYLHAEYEYLTYKSDLYNQFHTIENIISENVLVGGGLKQMISDDDGFYLLLLYNINQTIYTPYNPLVFRAGIMITI